MRSPSNSGSMLSLQITSTSIYEFSSSIYLLLIPPLNPDRKFPKHMTSGLMSFRELVTGQGEVGLFDLATSEFDLKEAVKKYRFAILPKVCDRALVLS